LTDLVRYSEGGATFSDVVSDFASFIHPLLGLNKIVSKVIASRVEIKRLNVTAARDRNSHRERMTELRALDKQRTAIVAAKRAEIVSQERLGLRQLEMDFDAQMQSIRLSGALRRFEIERNFAAEMARIDVVVKVRMAQLAETRRQNTLHYRYAQERAREADKSRRHLHDALREATRLMGQHRFAEIASGTVGVLSRTSGGASTQTRQASASVAARRVQVTPSTITIGCQGTVFHGPSESPYQSVQSRAWKTASRPASSGASTWDSKRGHQPAK
jgi:hypothetical protein